MNRAGFLPELACALAWGAEDNVAVLWGDFDETGHPSDPNVTAFGVCGLRATCQQWLAFSEKWNAALADYGVDVFHMKTFYSPRHSPYNRWPDERKQAFLTLLLDLIEPLVPVLGSMKKFEEDVEGAERETIQEDWRESYHGGIRSALFNVPHGSKVHFVFAQHPEISSTVVGEYHAMLAQSYAENLHDARVGTFTFGEPKELPPLQAADYLAWEFARDARYGRGNMRPTLQRILSWRNPTRIYVR